MLKPLIFSLVLIKSFDVGVPAGSGSPCPELYEYDEFGASFGKLKATLTLRTDVDLHGIWVRIKTNPPLTNVTVEDFENSSVIYRPNSQEFTIKNRDYILERSSVKTIKISASYEGDAVPELISFKLNGKSICEYENSTSTFKGDLKSPNFLQDLISSAKLKEPEGICGKSNLQINKPNDNIAILPEHFPWHAFISHNTDEFVCEATLISNNAVLTAAHCVSKSNTTKPINVKGLRVNLKKIHVDDEKDSHEHVVELIHVYPAYDPETLYGDVAVVKFKGNFTSDDNLQPICLPDPFQVPREGFVVAYGFREDGNVTNLSAAKLTPLEKSKCIGYDADLSQFMSNNEYCATYVQEREICVGSSGSGVYASRLNEELLWELNGIITVGRPLHGKFQCDKSSPVLITNISNYLKWIRGSL